MGIVDKNSIKHSSPAVCMSASLFLLSSAGALGYWLLIKCDEVKKAGINHSFLWIATFCIGTGGLLFFVLSFLNEPKIVLTGIIGIDVSHAILITIVGFLFASLSASYALLKRLRWCLIEIRNRTEIDNSPIIAFFSVIKELTLELMGYLKSRYWHKLKDIRSKKEKTNSE